jgi:hypothetical protein
MRALHESSRAAMGPRRNRERRVYRGASSGVGKIIRHPAGGLSPVGPYRAAQGRGVERPMSTSGEQSARRVGNGQMDTHG